MIVNYGGVTVPADESAGAVKHEKFMLEIGYCMGRKYEHAPDRANAQRIYKCWLRIQEEVVRAEWTV